MAVFSPLILNIKILFFRRGRGFTGFYFLFYTQINVLVLFRFAQISLKFKINGKASYIYTDKRVC